MELSQIFKKYNEYPDFLGIEITNVNQKGSIDDAIIHIAARNNQMQDIVDLVIYRVALCLHAWIYRCCSTIIKTWCK